MIDRLELEPLPQRIAATLLAAPLALAWTHGLAALLRAVPGSNQEPLALGLTTASLIAVTAAAAFSSRSAWRVAGLASLLAGLVVGVVGGGSWVAAVAPLAAVPAVWAGRRLAPDLAAVGHRRAVMIVCLLLGGLGVVQTGRLATTTSDPSIPFLLTTTHPFWFGHQCLPAYLHGAELVARGDENLYASHHYPALDPAASPKTALAMTVDDPFQYPPQFLLLPHLALQLTQDFHTLRVVWFALQLTLYCGVFLWIAHWVGGRAGALASLLLPATLAAFPLLHNFQFGQFHLPAIALSLAALLCFSRRRFAIGGLLLATAVLAKIFPIVLVVLLACARRWKAVFATAAAGLAVTALTLTMLGPQPFVAFFQDHLPKLADGSAFAFDEAWPELAGLVLADNQGAFGLARKLGADKPLAGWINRLFLIVVLGLAAWIGARATHVSRWSRVNLWLGLLGLASLGSAGAWGDYVPATAVWLLALNARIGVEVRAARPVFFVLAASQALLLGTMPIGDWADPRVMLPLATLGSAGLFATFAVAAWYRPEQLVGRSHDQAVLADPGPVAPIEGY